MIKEKDRCMDNSLISIIVPIYNIDKYLERCISSIINQTYLNIEILLIDDGSTDNSYDICEEYAQKDTRIKVFHKENGGLSDARNRGIAEAKGMYFIFVDGDDFIHPQMVETLYKVITEFKTDICVCDYIRVADNQMPQMIIHENVISSDNVRIFTGLEAMQLLFGKLKEYLIFTVAWNKIYHRSLFEDIQYPIGKIHEDEFTAYRLMFKASSVAYIKKELYYYVQRAGSITEKGFSEKTFDRIEAYKERAEFCIEHDAYVRESIMRYLGEYQFFIDTFREKYRDKKKNLRELNKKFKHEYKAYKCHLSYIDCMKIRVRNAHPVIWKKAKHMILKNF